MYKPKRVVITGGSSGLGLNFAETFAERGAEVILIARGADLLAKARDQIIAKTPSARVSITSLDVTQSDLLNAAAMEIAASGDIDLLINSAGILREGYIDNVDGRTYTDQMSINYFGTVNAVRAFLPQLRRTRGRIVNIGSLSGVAPVFGYSGYCASKFAVQGFSEVLRLELKPAGVDVHVVCPGEFESPMLVALEGQRSPENVAHTSVLPAISTATVVEDTLRGIDAGRFEIVPTMQARITRLLMRTFPVFFQGYADRLIGKVYVGPR
jgi:3-dehydrosphinganine reductase